MVVIDHKPPLDAKRIVAETVAAQPDAFIVLMTPDARRGARARPVAAPARSSASSPAPISAGSSPASSPRGCGCRSSSASRRSSSRSSSLEYGKLQRREKLLDVVVKERTKELQVAYDRLKAALAAGAARARRGDRGQGSVHQGPLRPHRGLRDRARPRGAALRGGPRDARVRRLPARHRQDRHPGRGAAQARRARRRRVEAHEDPPGRRLRDRVAARHAEADDRRASATTTSAGTAPAIPTS